MVAKFLVGKRCFPDPGNRSKCCFADRAWNTLENKYQHRAGIQRKSGGDHGDIPGGLDHQSGCSGADR